MKNTFPPLPVRIVIILIVLSTIGYYAFRALSPEENGQLKASGTIEAVVVNVSPEMAGKVQDVLVSEGQSTQANTALLHLDDSLLQSEKQTAQTALDSAKAAVHTAEVALESVELQYDIAVTNALAQEKTTRITIWKDSKPTQFDQPVWYF